jgi:excisionase family DNA binding protein
MEPFELDQSSEQRLMRVSEAAEYLAVKESTVRAWLLKGRISCVRVGGRAVRIPFSEIKRLINEGTVPARALREDGGRRRLL